MIGSGWKDVGHLLWPNVKSAGYQAGKLAGNTVFSECIIVSDVDAAFEKHTFPAARLDKARPSENLSRKSPLQQVVLTSFQQGRSATSGEASLAWEDGKTQCSHLKKGFDTTSFSHKLGRHIYIEYHDI